MRPQAATNDSNGFYDQNEVQLPLGADGESPLTKRTKENTNHGLNLSRSTVWPLVKLPRRRRRALIAIVVFVVLLFGIHVGLMMLLMGVNLSPSLASSSSKNVTVSTSLGLKPDPRRDVRYRKKTITDSDHSDKEPRVVPDRLLPGNAPHDTRSRAFYDSATAIEGIDINNAMTEQKTPSWEVLAAPIKEQELQAQSERKEEQQEGPQNKSDQQNDHSSQIEDIDDFPVVTQFDDKCRLVGHAEYARRLLRLEQEQNDTALQEEHNVAVNDMDGNATEPTAGYPGKSIGDVDKLRLGRCYYGYHQRFPPAQGYLAEIDYFHQRNDHKMREACHTFCVTQLSAAERTPNLLAQAAEMGLTQAAAVLVSKYSVDPTAFTTLPGGWSPAQVALRGGHAALLKAMLQGNNSKVEQIVIDAHNRTVKDYLLMRASPIRPADALKFFGVNTTKAQGQEFPNNTQPPTIPDYLGWNTTSARVPSSQCDFVVIQGPNNMTRQQFYKDYFMPGRPFVLRGVFHDDELKQFAKSRWATQTNNFTLHTRVRVGPTGYPSLTGQQRCPVDQTIAELEIAKKCDAMPNVSMFHARHPKTADWTQLYPPSGDYYSGGWSMLDTFFGPERNKFHKGWQLFFGGDGSGAALHWHKGALNVLYAGIKEWVVTPPHYRGFTGMPSSKVMSLLDTTTSLKCTQVPGDLFYIPDFWGHATYNAGFAIGAAYFANDRQKLWLHKMEQENKPGIVTSPPSEPRDGGEMVAETNKMTSAKDRNIGTKPAVDDPQVLFVHINKTGGTSMIRMLEERCPVEYRKDRWEGGHRTFHATAHAQIEHYGREAWNKAYTFAIVRHPLARQVSNFFFLLGRCQRQYSSLCGSRKIPKDFQAETDQARIEAFHEYTQTLYELYPPGSPDHYLFGSAGHGNEIYSTMNATQTSWLVDPSDETKVAVQHIFTLEGLSNDMGEITNSLPCLKNNVARNRGDTAEHDKDTNATEVINRRSLLVSTHETEPEDTMPQLNESPKYPDYRRFGDNEKTNEILREVFSVDYHNFGYEM